MIVHEGEQVFFHDLLVRLTIHGHVVGQKVQASPANFSTVATRDHDTGRVLDGADGELALVLVHGFFTLLTVTFLALSILNVDSPENMASIHCFSDQLRYFLAKGKPFHLRIESEKVFFRRLANKHAPTSSRFLDKLGWHILSTKHFILQLFGSLEWKLLHIMSQPLVQPISADSLFRPDLLIGRWGMQLIRRQGLNIKGTVS